MYTPTPHTNTHKHSNAQTRSGEWWRQWFYRHIDEQTTIYREIRRHRMLLLFVANVDGMEKNPLIVCCCCCLVWAYVCCCVCTQVCIETIWRRLALSQTFLALLSNVLFSMFHRYIDTFCVVVVVSLGCFGIYVSKHTRRACWCVWVCLPKWRRIVPGGFWIRVAARRVMDAGKISFRMCGRAVEQGWVGWRVQRRRKRRKSKFIL